MKILPKINVLILIIFLNIIGFSQTIEDGWKGIKPLKTGKARVEKLLGESEANQDGFQNYRTNDAFIRINYSTARCEGNRYEGDEYNVAKNIVLNYSVRFKEIILLSEFKFKRDKYLKDTSGDLISVADYRSEEEGVSIGVYIQEGVEYVTDVEFKPRKKDAEIFRCKEDRENSK